MGGAVFVQTLAFTSELLDTIEETLADVEEHKFNIHERIAAIKLAV